MNALLNLHGAVVYVLVGLVVFAEDALFVGFVLPGETAAVLGGVAAERGNVSLVGMLAVVLRAVEKYFRRIAALVAVAVVVVALVVWRVREYRRR